ncbi:MAG: ketopantoate reductase family protein [Atopobiaceae bacterium]
MGKPRIAIVGKGALGMLYGSMAQDALGEDAVTFVMDPARLARHAGDVCTVNGKVYPFRDATPDAAGEQDLVILATKSYGLESALDLVPGLLGEKTRIVSVLNGIRSEERVAARFGWEHIVPCVAQGMDAAHYGSSLTFSKAGALYIGRFDKTPEAALDDVVDILTQAGIAHVVEADIRYRMWAKFMLNVGINQTCCAFGASYGDVYEDETSELWRTFISAMREVVALAQAEGVALTEKDLSAYAALERTLDPASTPSMGQDRINHHRTEVDEFSGEVMRRAEKHGILVPVNAFLNKRIREIETSYLSEA